MPGGEKTESATPRRREEARKRGQVARSTELTSVAVLFAGLLYFKWMGASFLLRFDELFRDMVFRSSKTDMRIEDLTGIGIVIFIWALGTLGPAFAALFFAALAANLAQVGLMFTFTPLMPDLSRLNPAQGFKRIFSGHGAMELLKSIVKLGIVTWIVYGSIQERLTSLGTMSLLDARSGAALMTSILFDAAMNAVTALFVLAVADFAYQRFSYEKSLKMTLEEVKEEMKQTEGNPLIKSRIRMQQREMARRRMMQEVPNASVVITNPTHFAVALKYESGVMKAPRVIAKGQDLIALRIKEIALENSVPIYEDKLLARALFKSAEIGDEIPADLYHAVAEVLAFVFGRLKRRAAAFGLSVDPITEPLLVGAGSASARR